MRGWRRARVPRGPGILAEGIEISSMAREKAPAHLRGRIHQGDLLDLNLPGGYDLVFGLDVFEHLNPNRLDGYVARLALLSSDDAFLFCNIPVFGDDPVIVQCFRSTSTAGSAMRSRGARFPPFMSTTAAIRSTDISPGRTRDGGSRAPSDGFRRDEDIERALHAKDDGYMEKRSPARRSFFVFAKGACRGRRQAILGRIANEPSTAIA